MTAQRLRTIVWVLLLAASTAYLAGFAAVAVARVIYPYQLDVMEGAAVDALDRILQGKSLYVAPSIDYVPLIYTPLYYYVSALVATVTGSGLFTLRLVSSVASLVSFVLVCRFVWRETGSPAAGVVACGLFAGTYSLSDRVMDQAKVDSLFVCLLLGALYLARSSDRRPGAGVWEAASAGAVAGLAILTKQTSLVIAIALVVYLGWHSTRRGFAFGLTAAVVSGLPLAILVVQTDGWARVYLLDLPSLHSFREDQVTAFWTANILPRLTFPLLVSPLFMVGRFLHGERRTAAFFAVASLAMLGLAWVARANQGASNTVLLPAFAILAVLFGLGLHEGLRMLQDSSAERRSFQLYLLSVCAVQFIVLSYNPRLMVPYRSDAWASDRLVTTIAGLNGTVFAPGFGLYLRQAGRPAQAYRVPVEEITGLWGTPSPLGTQWMAEVSQALQNRQYDYVITEREVFFLGGVLEANGYVPVGPLFPPGDQFWLWTSGWTLAADIYIPRERAAGISAELPAAP